MKKIKAQKLNLWIHGATGRMGREIQKAILEAKDRFSISGGSSRVFEGEFFYQGQPVTAEKLNHALEKTDVMIDFSTAEAHGILIDALKKGFKNRLSILIGTTGLSKKQIDFWEKSAKKNNFSVLFAPNTSLGVLVLRKAIQLAAQTLTKKGFEVLIHETHHNKKKDAPSGTGKLLAEAIQFPSEQILSMRAGGIVGEHEVRFVSANEEVTMSHRAFSRSLFAEGALILAEWLALQPAGCYLLDDVKL